MVSQPVTFAVPGAFASTRQSSGSSASFVTEMMLEYARGCREKPEFRKMQDDVYGEGFAEFFGEALKAFYTRK